MIKEAFDQGFITQCHAMGLTNPNEINYLYKQAATAMEVQQAMGNDMQEAQTIIDALRQAGKNPDFMSVEEILQWVQANSN